jgi:hypothetical protein
MVGTIGLALLGAGILAMCTIAVLAALRVRRVARAAASMRSHPIFETQWREHQSAVVRRLNAGVTALGEKLRELGPAIAKVAIAIEALRAAAYDTSRPVERLLRTELPWLVGLFRAS